MAVDAPSGTGWTCSAAGPPLRERLGLPGAATSACAVVRRAAIPPRPAAVSRAVRRTSAHSAWQEWMRVGFELFAALAGARRSSRPPTACHRGAGRRRALPSGRALRDLPRRDILRAARPSPAAPSARRRACRSGSPCSSCKGDRRRGRRPVAAHARRARRLRGGVRGATGSRRAWAGWVGDPREGVIVLPAPSCATATSCRLSHAHPLDDTVVDLMSATAGSPGLIPSSSAASRDISDTIRDGPQAMSTCAVNAVAAGRRHDAH